MAIKVEAEGYEPWFSRPLKLNEGMFRCRWRCALGGLEDHGPASGRKSRFGCRGGFGSSRGPILAKGPTSVVGEESIPRCFLPRMPEGGVHPIGNGMWFSCWLRMKVDFARGQAEFPCDGGRLIHGPTEIVMENSARNDVGAWVRMLTWEPEIWISNPAVLEDISRPRSVRSSLRFLLANGSERGPARGNARRIHHHHRDAPGVPVGAGRGGPGVV